MNSRYDQLTASQKSMYDALTQAGVDQTTALETAIGGVRGDIGQLQADMNAKLQDSIANTNTQVSNLGTSLGSQVTNLGSSLGSQIGAVQQQAQQAQQNQAAFNVASLLSPLLQDASKPTVFTPVYGTMDYADLYESPFASRKAKQASTERPAETKMAEGGVVDPFYSPRTWDDFYKLLD